MFLLVKKGEVLPIVEYGGKFPTDFLTAFPLHSPFKGLCPQTQTIWSPPPLQPVLPSTTLGVPGRLPGSKTFLPGNPAAPPNGSCLHIGTAELADVCSGSDSLTFGKASQLYHFAIGTAVHQTRF